MAKRRKLSKDHEKLIFNSLREAELILAKIYDIHDDGESTNIEALMTLILDLRNELKNNKHVILTFGLSLDADIKINSIKQNIVHLIYTARKNLWIYL